METIRFRLQTYEIKMETDWSKLVQIRFSTKKGSFLITGSRFYLIGSTLAYQVYCAVISLQNTFNIFLQSRERNLTLSLSKSKKQAAPSDFWLFLGSKRHFNPVISA